jgi:hypothetical protein
MPFVAFDDIGQRRQLGLFWVAFDAAHQRVGAVQEHAVHFVRHFRKARYCLGMMWSRTASFFAGSLTMRNASFAAMLSPPWPNATQRCISRTHDQNQTPCSTIIPRHRVACDTDM